MVKDARVALTAARSPPSPPFCRGRVTITQAVYWVERPGIELRVRFISIGSVPFLHLFLPVPDGLQRPPGHMGPRGHGQLLGQHGVILVTRGCLSPVLDGTTLTVDGEEGRQVGALLL